MEKWMVACSGEHLAVLKVQQLVDDLASTWAVKLGYERVAVMVVMTEMAMAAMMGNDLALLKVASRVHVLAEQKGR